MAGLSPFGLFKYSPGLPTPQLLFQQHLPCRHHWGTGGPRHLLPVPCTYVCGAHTACRQHLAPKCPFLTSLPCTLSQNPTSVLVALCPITPSGSFLCSIERCWKSFCSFISWSNTCFLLLACKHNLFSLLCPEIPNQVVAHGGHYANARGERILFY